MRASGLLGPQTRQFGSPKATAFGAPKVRVLSPPVLGETVTVRLENPLPFATQAALFKSYGGVQTRTLPGGANLFIRDEEPITFVLPAGGLDFQLPLPSNFDENTAITTQLVIAEDHTGSETASSRGVSILLNSRP